MDNYGFVLVTKEEAAKLNMPNGAGLFSDLFTYMQQEVKRNPSKKFECGTALDMSEEERRISFMNRYFMFRKTRSVNAKKVGELLMKNHGSGLAEGLEEELFTLAGEPKKNDVVKPTAAVKTKTRKLKLKSFVPVDDDNDNDNDDRLRLPDVKLKVEEKKEEEKKEEEAVVEKEEVVVKPIKKRKLVIKPVADAETEEKEEKDKKEKKEKKEPKEKKTKGKKGEDA
jgi:hypothetical protein